MNAIVQAEQCCEIERPSLRTTLAVPVANPVRRHEVDQRGAWPREGNIAKGGSMCTDDNIGASEYADLVQKREIAGLDADHAQVLQSLDHIRFIVDDAIGIVGLVPPA